MQAAPCGEHVRYDDVIGTSWRSNLRLAVPCVLKSVIASPREDGLSALVLRSRHIGIGETTPPVKITVRGISGGRDLLVMLNANVSSHSLSAQ
jgi:hypothetical protein